MHEFSSWLVLTSEEDHEDSSTAQEQRRQQTNDRKKEKRTTVTNTQKRKIPRAPEGSDKETSFIHVHWRLTGEKGPSRPGSIALHTILRHSRKGASEDRLFHHS